MLRSNAPFVGFEQLDASFVFTPNQFFDFCLPNFSRGTVRLVAYILHQTLRHLDEEGNPVREDIAIPYRQLIRNAGISRGAIRDAIDEALQAKLIVCTNEGKKDSQDTKRSVGEYRLAWDSPAAQYTVDRAKFNGFFSGEGYRTPTPHSYFTLVIPTQTNATSKIVGAVIRHTVGYQSKHGGRKKEASLSYRYLQQYTRIASKETLSDGLKTALRSGFIERTEVGEFIPGARPSSSSRYTLKWLQNNKSTDTSSKTVPDQTRDQKPYADRFKNRTGTKPETVPDNQTKNRTDKKELQKQTNKQQHVVADGSLRSFELLVEQGVTPETATQIAKTIPFEQIRRQVGWLTHRPVRSNPAGFLVSACLNDYPEPDELKRERLGAETGGGDKWHRKDEVKRAIELKHYRERRDALLTQWKQQGREDRQRWQQRAIERAQDAKVKRSIEFDSLQDENTHKLILDEMALDLGLHPITESSIALQSTS